MIKDLMPPPIWILLAGETVELHGDRYTIHEVLDASDPCWWHPPKKPSRLRVWWYCCKRAYSK